MKKIFFYKIISDISLLDILFFIQIDDITKIIPIAHFYKALAIVFLLIGIFQFIIVNIFLENIQLNFCGLNDNLEINIMLRGIKEKNYRIGDDEGKIEIDNNYYVNMIDHSQEENINN